MKTRVTAPQRLVYASLLVLMFTPLRTHGQDAKLQINHLEKLADRATEVVDVTLDGQMLQLASRFMSGKRSPDEAKAKDLISNLKGIYVKSFEFDKKGEYAEADIDSIRSQLRAPLWSRIVGVRSKRQGENAEVYLMGDDDNIQGLAIISAEPKELTVVNIVGPIDVDKLSELGGHFGVPRLELERTGKPRKGVGTHDNTK